MRPSIWSSKARIATPPNRLPDTPSLIFFLRQHQDSKIGTRVPQLLPGTFRISLPNHQTHLKTRQISISNPHAGNLKWDSKGMMSKHTAIATQQRLTYGLNLSPIRAARQNVPSGLKGPKEQRLSQHFGRGIHGEKCGLKGESERTGDCLTRTCCGLARRGRRHGDKCRSR